VRDWELTLTSKRGSLLLLIIDGHPKDASLTILPVHSNCPAVNSVVFCTSHDDRCNEILVNARRAPSSGCSYLAPHQQDKQEPRLSVVESLRKMSIKAPKAFKRYVSL